MENVIKQKLFSDSLQLCSRNTYKSILCGAGLIFLKYISHACFEQNENPKSNIKGKILLPEAAMWQNITREVNNKDLGFVLDNAFAALEKINPSLKLGMENLYSSKVIDKAKLKNYIENLALIPGYHHKIFMVLGTSFAFFLEKFLELKNSMRAICTLPVLVERLLMKMALPGKGVFFDTCCSTGNGFIESPMFRHNGNLQYYGHVEDVINYRLCRMNLALKGMLGINLKFNPETVVEQDAFEGLNADYILCVPQGKKGINQWLQYVNAHMAEQGTAAVVMEKTAFHLSEQSRKNYVETNLLDCVISLPDNITSKPGVTLCIWILARDRGKRNLSHKNRMDGGKHNSTREILFIDAALEEKKEKPKDSMFSEQMMEKITGTYQQWRLMEDGYDDISGFCKSVSPAVVKGRDFQLAPEQYV